MTIQYRINDQPTNLSDDFVALSNRKRDLDAVPYGDPSADREIMAAAYEALADEFEAESHYIMAGACRKAAERWKA